MSDLSKRFPRYSRLVRMYPKKYQQEYSDQMLQTLADMLDDAQTKRKRTLIWTRVTLDLPVSIMKQQLTSGGEVMWRDTPDYIKYNAVVAAVLLLPFFVLLLLDAVTAHALYHTWLWKTPVLATWLIVMPAAAFVLSTGTLVRWAFVRIQQGGVGYRKVLFDFRHNWTMLTAIVLSLGIIALAFGHDSVHCVTHNPITEARNWHNTWRCIQQR